MRAGVRELAAGALVVGAAVCGMGAAAASRPPHLTAVRAVGVSGVAASESFVIGGRAIRQVRYDDNGTLVYRFEVRNDGDFDVHVRGLAPGEPSSRLFHPRSVAPVTVPAHGSATVSFAVGMSGCESLSARSGSFVSQVGLQTEQAGLFDHVVWVTLPEELHTGSAREAFCSKSSATSRPPG